MQVVILAGGLGTRISELTDAIPKPMVQIGDDPILLHIMRHFASYGHTKFIIALGYKGFSIKEYFTNFEIHMSDIRVETKSGRIDLLDSTIADWEVSLVDTGLNTATGGRLLKLTDYLEDEFLLTYGDGLSNVNLDALIAQYHASTRHLATVTAVRPPARFGTLKVEAGEVLDFSEKDPQDSGWINGGYFCMSRKVLSYIKDFDMPLESQPLRQLATEGKFGAHFHEGFWLPMDTLRDKRNLEELWLKGNPPWSQ